MSDSKDISSDHSHERPINALTFDAETSQQEERYRNAPYRVALDRAIYLLDRDLAPTQKVRAFTKGRATLDRLGAEQVEQRVRTLSLIHI